MITERKKKKTTTAMVLKLQAYPGVIQTYPGVI
jgi:hypothetical protein